MRTHTFSFHSSTCPACTLKIAHMVELTVIPPRNTLVVTPTLHGPLHCIRTSDHVTPVGPPHPHGHLSRKALTSAHSRCHCDLPPFVGVLPGQSGETAEFGGTTSNCSHVYIL